MSVFDISLLVIIGGFALFGLWFGFVHTLGSLLGTILGAYLAGRFYEPFATWLIHITGWPENRARVIMFILAFIIINRLVGFIFWIVDKTLSVITRLPFIRSINRLLGLLLGLAEGMITVGLIFFFIERYPLSPSIMDMIAHSAVVPYTTGIAAILVPLLPMALRVLKSSVEYVRQTVL